MKILITGICGFVGSELALSIKQSDPGIAIFGIDNFSRQGAYLNKALLEKSRIKVFPGDIRMASDMEALPKADWVIDAAANPSVLAGVDGHTGPRQLLEHNLLSTVNILEYCRRHEAGFLLLSTSRVYSVKALAAIPVIPTNDAFDLDSSKRFLPGLSREGIDVEFPTNSPISLYGASKLASETISLEYGEAFGFPVWINRCGVLAGAGQFGKPNQGIVSFWINSWLHQKPLKYIGFSGTVYQVRDCLHPQDLASLILMQIFDQSTGRPKTLNLGGGPENRFSLLQLTNWCVAEMGRHEVLPSTEERPYDAPWIVMDNSTVYRHWGWKPTISSQNIFREVLEHAKKHPDWLKVSGAE